MKLPRLRRILLVPLVLFALFYFTGVVMLQMDNRPVGPLAGPLDAVFWALGTSAVGVDEKTCGMMWAREKLRAEEFEHRSRLGTRSIVRYSDAYDRRQ